jgi:mycothiol synthase
VSARADVVRSDDFGAELAADVLRLAEAADAADGTPPLSDDALLRLRHPGAGLGGSAVHLLGYRDDRLAGYGQLGGDTAELFVHPSYRRRGLGRELVDAAIDAATGSDPAARPSFWAHGDHPSANSIALSLGLRRTRVLWRMRRPLAEPVPDPQMPDGVVLRAFRPGVDDAAWLGVNARSFVDLPDQGGWGLAELTGRQAETWFDAEGFLLAERTADSELLGFHWTKIHGQRGDSGWIGEVYVLGVDPAAQGSGLGAALTLAGLRYLHERGLPAVMLYVDELNRAAIRLYERLGFARWSTDVCFRLPST